MAVVRAYYIQNIELLHSCDFVYIHTMIYDHSISLFTEGCVALRKKDNNLAYVGYTREKSSDGKYPHGTTGQVSLEVKTKKFAVKPMHACPTDNYLFIRSKSASARLYIALYRGNIFT